MSRIGWNIAGPLCALAVCAFALAALLNVAKFRSALTDVQQRTYGVVAEDLRERIELGISFGVPLEAFGGMEELFERTLLSNPEVIQLGVRDPSGRPVFSSSSSVYLSEEQVSDIWLISRSLHNAGGGVVGTLEVSVSKEAYWTTMRGIVSSTILRATGVCFLTMALIIGVVQFSLRPIARSLNEDTERLEDIADRFGSDQIGELEIAFIEFARSHRRLRGNRI